MNVPGSECHGHCPVTRCYYFPNIVFQSNSLLNMYISFKSVSDAHCEGNVVPPGMWGQRLKPTTAACPSTRSDCVRRLGLCPLVVQVGLGGVSREGHRPEVELRGVVTSPLWDPVPFNTFAKSHLKSTATSLLLKANTVPRTVRCFW